jgi:hypothetical protein
MKRIIFMFAMVLSLSACDNTKVQLHAPTEAEKATMAQAKTPDSLQLDSAKVKTDTIANAPQKPKFKISN